VAIVVIDDHLLRDVLAGDRSPDLGGLFRARLVALPDEIEFMPLR
jgi:hypothetical protein